MNGKKITGNPQKIVSLSTIPPRLQLVGRTLQSIMRNSVRPDNIELYIPRFYRRFPAHSFCLPEVPDGVKIEVVEEDLGPATKALYCAKKYRGKPARIIYCDDDQVYGTNWIEKLLRSAEKRPTECIAGCGHDIAVENCGLSTCGQGRPLPRVVHRQFPTGGIKYLPQNIPRWAWRECLRLMIQFKFIHPPMMKIVADSGYADIAAGCGGVVVLPDFFDDMAFNIPPVLWSVDDYWLSGCLVHKGISNRIEK